ncbi:MAG: lysine biosynthesis protein LysX [Nitrosopumilus sp.]|nr:lysine biosynthesis protein LysX [Nitrosopumilus sp.]CAI9830892.1 Alpha-aminoadipate--LysW ligase LysX [Nitrosopumilaceae archaeon]MDA7941303.1 lysine biosynthesis protein LysX [Nitrosopumilus sp.]MDA7942714.1 lysine biosynthesis protein LysX [Nitrosopumilus sp.]MDA7945300.1 lysine biosynthesis protein LysX [Nitrosopumilus sp.]
MSAGVAVLHDAVRWEEKALLEAGKRSGIPVRMVDCRELAIAPGTEPPVSGTILQRCVSYYRSIHSTAALEGAGARVINTLEAALLAGNKLFTHVLLRRAGVRTPRAAVAFSAEAAVRAIEGIGYPAVLKPTVGSWGRMVSRVNDRDAAEGVIEGRESMHPSYHAHYVEEFVRRPPRDIRAIVVGDEVVAAIYRASENWKTNTALGGRAEPCEVTGELEDVCIRARDAVRGQIVGVDLMEDEERGLVVHEVNGTTEYKNTVRVCGVDIPTKMLRYAAGLG